MAVLYSSDSESEVAGPFDRLSEEDKSSDSEAERGYQSAVEMSVIL